MLWKRRPDFRCSHLDSKHNFPLKLLFHWYQYIQIKHLEGFWSNHLQDRCSLVTVCRFGMSILCFWASLLPRKNLNSQTPCWERLTCQGPKIAPSKRDTETTLLHWEFCIFFAGHHSHGLYCPLLDSTTMRQRHGRMADSTTVTGVTGTFCRSLHIASGSVSRWTFLCIHETFCFTVCLESFSQNVTLQLSLLFSKLEMNIRSCKRPCLAHSEAGDVTHKSGGVE